MRKDGRDLERAHEPEPRHVGRCHGRNVDGRYRQCGRGLDEVNLVRRLKHVVLSAPFGRISA